MGMTEPCDQLDLSPSDQQPFEQSMEVQTTPQQPLSKSAKKRKRQKAKKAAAASVGEEKPLGQTDPPTIPVDVLFTSKKYPEGEISEYPKLMDNTVKAPENEIKRVLDEANFEMLNDLRRAAEVHRQTRKYVQSWIAPGMSMTSICEKLEDCARRLISADGLRSGLAFPTGCSLAIVMVILFC
ncbi:hypothetical protein ACOME3_007287 [Neoechinorhynchus agilis]